MALEAICADALLVSCGVGEDISFDVEFLNRFGGAAILIDPTPRALIHYEAVLERLGLSPEQPMNQDGHVDPSSYELSELQRSQFDFQQVAVSNFAGEAKFYAPPDASHVSYSLINFRNGYRVDTKSIDVSVVPLGFFLESQTREVQVLKLDIEGSEIEAVESLADSRCRPAQILIEFDELALPSRKSTRRFRRADDLLRNMGYDSVYFDGRTCVTYVRKDFLA